MQKQVNIGTVAIEGFRSYTSPTVFKFGKVGLFLLSGLNGAGKTTIFSALYWCLYGDNLNSTNNGAVATWKRLRGKDWKGTRVKVTLRVGRFHYMIVRHLAYSGETMGVKGENSLMIFKKEDKRPWQPSDMLGADLYKDDQQKFINKLLGVSSFAFINSIIFGQRLSRLVSVEPKHKRELFEEFFEMDFIDAAKEKAEAERDKLTPECYALQVRISDLSGKLSGYKDRLEQHDRILETFILTRKERLAEIKIRHTKSKEKCAELQDKLEKLRKKVSKSSDKSELRNLMEHISSIEEKLGAARSKHRKAVEAVESVDKKIRELDLECVLLAKKLRETPTTCITCGQALNKATLASVKDNIQKDIIAREKAMNDLRWSRGEHAKVVDTEKALVEELETEYKAAYDKYDAARNMAQSTEQVEINRLERDLAVEESIKQSLVERHKEIKEQQPPVDEITKRKLVLAIEAAEAELATLQDDLAKKTAELERVNWWIKKGFGSSGMKSYIFSAMLDKLNELAYNYSKYFGFSVRFGVDLSKASKPFTTTIYEGTHEVDYADLSGGQKQRVDIALAFAMHDLVSSKVKFNLLVMDEAFDNLDAEGVAMVNSIFDLKSKDRAVYVVSHNPMFTPQAIQTFEITGGNKHEPSTIH